MKPHLRLVHPHNTIRAACAEALPSKRLMRTSIFASTAFAAPLPLSSSKFNSSLSPQRAATQRFQRTRPRLPKPNTRQTDEVKASAIAPNLPKHVVPYFAYFANINPYKIGPLSRSSSRRCEIYRSQKALLPLHDLVFNVPGMPPEPAFANIVKHPSASVHGVLHWLSRTDFRRIARTEGVLPQSPLTLFTPLSPFASVKDVRVITTNDDGTTQAIAAKTLVFNPPVPGFLRSRMRPSRRYVQLAVDGAEYWGFDGDYVQKLKTIPTARGPLGGFGLFVEPRPHLLDRPNSYEQFGKPTSEIYSPWSSIRATAAVEAVERDARNTRGTDLRLLRVSNTTKENGAQRKPLYYIPGIDGTGKGILSQIHGLDEEGVYVVSTFIYPFANRQSLQQLAEDAINLIKGDAGDKSVTIVGESMGGVVSLQLAMENERRLREDSSLARLNIDNLMLINPATSFKRASPRALWDLLLSLGISEELYARLLPPVLLPLIVDFRAMRKKFGPDLFPRLRKMLSSLVDMSEVLPQDALSWRLKLLSEVSIGKEALKPLSGEFGPSKIALISTVNDNLIPSHSESYRLRRYIPKLYTMILPYGGHVPSFDGRFSLAAFLRAFNDAPAKTASDGPLAVPSPSVLKRRAAFRKRFANGSENGSDEKTREQLGRLRLFLEKSTKESSPVFIGEENIPEYDPQRPILFVCNHTLLGWLDAMYPVERILKERNVLIRSLAHPKLFEQAKQAQLAFPNTPRVNSSDLDEFGIVKVSPRQLLEQLSGGRWSLLFPGGAREALKENEGDKYSLKWPDDPEFIRACALFGARVIPVSTVGSEDMVRIVASPKQVQRALDAGSRLIGRPIDWSVLSFEGVPWRDQMDREGEFALVPPLMLPTGADRLYFRFGKVIEVDESCLYDERLERRVYEQVREGVREGIEMLLRRRESDEFRDRERRRAFEDEFGGNAVAPCGNAWLWSRNGAFLDEDKQPPLG